MRRAELLRLFWIGAATILVVAALVALAAVVSGSFDSTDAKILGSLGTLLLAGAVATVGAALREAQRSPGLGATLAAAAPLLGLVAAAAIWNEFDASTRARRRASGRRSWQGRRPRTSPPSRRRAQPRRTSRGH